ncbi:hypothetical protein HMP06_2302 [Sphingomonas sp. HMP6]|nr:hypothetical protein HMP06_2302 [Sphingomonas sp. HMP6]
MDDYLTEDSPVRIVDVFVDELDLAALGFANAAATGRPGYNPAILFSIYRYRNQVQSSRRLEREAGRNVELMWLTGKLAPNFKTLADFRRDHGRSHFKTRMLRNVGVKSGPTLEYSLMCGNSFRPMSDDNLVANYWALRGDRGGGYMRWLLLLMGLRVRHDASQLEAHCLALSNQHRRR